MEIEEQKTIQMLLKFHDLGRISINIIFQKMIDQYLNNHDKESNSPRIIKQWKNATKEIGTNTTAKCYSTKLDDFYQIEYLPLSASVYDICNNIFRMKCKL